MSNEPKRDFPPFARELMDDIEIVPTKADRQIAKALQLIDSRIEIWNRTADATRYQWGSQSTTIDSFVEDLEDIRAALVEEADDE